MTVRAGELVPVQAGGNDSGGNQFADLGTQGDAAARVEDFDRIAVRMRGPKPAAAAAAGGTLADSPT